MKRFAILFALLLLARPALAGCAVSFPDVYAPAGATVTVPLFVSDARGGEGIDVKFAYDPNVIIVKGVSKGSLLPASMSVVYGATGVPEADGKARCRVVIYGAYAITGTHGILLNVTVGILGAPGTATKLDLEKININDGAILAAWADGKIQVVQP